MKQSFYVSDHYSDDQFWGAIQIYTKKPHVVNRKICGYLDIFCGVSEQSTCSSSLIKDISKVLHEDAEKSSVKDKGANSLSKFTEAVHVDKCFSSEDAGSSQAEQLKIVSVNKGLFNTNDYQTSGILKNFATQSLQKIEQIKDVILAASFEEFTLHGDTKDTGGVADPWSSLLNRRNKTVVWIRKILPKNSAKFKPEVEVFIADFPNRATTFFCERMESYSVLPGCCYQVQASPPYITLGVLNTACDNINSQKWLYSVVLPRLAKWINNISEDGHLEDQQSLRLIDIQSYNQVYQCLKIKYAHSLVKMWPESTDPLKFVYEDIAIAAYLLILWDNERTAKQLTQRQSFIDLGCGNGLLVYILSNEGHHGLGLDLKKRKIWDLYPDTVMLKEQPIKPSDQTLYPKYDWLIGNHSDELTPWLPVIAAKSSYSTSFFIIPCCAFDFDCKYCRTQAGRSQYSEYLDYITEIGGVCGFNVQRDKLRIPSTKRVCLIGQQRCYAREDESQILQNINSFIEKRSQLNRKRSSLNNDVHNKVNSIVASKDGIQSWSSEFKARDPVQPVRNCTKIEKTVKDNLLISIVNILLQKKCIVQIPDGIGGTKLWDRGGSSSLGDLAGNLGVQQKEALKKQCGGLQTLLRNHKNIFAICKGVVTLQTPAAISSSKVPVNRIQTKPCWFHLHHPQGCPISAHLCVYAHS